MAFDVSGLVNYTDQTSTDLLVKKTVKTKTAGFAKKVPSVKSSFALQLLSNTATHQDGSGCGFNASGTTAFTQRTLTTYAIKIEDTLCLRTLEAKWTQALLAAGQDYSTSDIPAAIMANIYDEEAENLETYDWTGTVAGAAKYDGLKTIIDAAVGVTEANAAAYVPGGAPLTAVDETNVIDVVSACYNALIANAPALLGQSNNYLFIPMEYFGYLTIAYLNKNYFVYNNAATAGAEDMIPMLGNPNIKIVGTVGLTGTKDCYLINGDNMFLGFDASSEETSARMWYSNDDDIHKYSIRFRRGWQIAYPTEIVKFTIA